MSDTSHDFWRGYQPVVQVSPGNPEAEKYGRMWEREEYRKVAPGEDLADLFLEVARPRPGSHVVDLGCGTGRGGAALFLREQMRVTFVDFARNCLDEKVRELIAAHPESLEFVKADLESPLPARAVAEYGYCTDVMEHVPEGKVSLVLKNVLAAAQHVFFSISTERDHCGGLIGEDLHLTVQKYGWWLRKFTEFDCVVHWSRDLGAAALFYVTAWPDAQAVVDVATVNVTDEQVRENTRRNCEGARWQQVTPYPENDVEVMVVGGGPSLAQFEGEIRRNREAGAKLVTLNGAYNWALERGLAPSATVVVDARPFNARFVRPVSEGCKYFICSQCDPSVFEGLPEERTYIWHTTNEVTRDVVAKDYPVYWPVPGGSTALLRAIPLLRMLGFKRFILYGCDSCCAPDLDPGSPVAHHAYPQPENAAPTFPVTCGERVFQCQTWMASQAQEFMGLIQGMGDEMELEVRGDGLLSHILATGARLYDERSQEMK